MTSTFSERFIGESVEILQSLDTEALERIAVGVEAVRNRGGRLFVLGVGGSAGHASHAVNDFRKICGIEAYAPTDNVSELTARTNDEGWETVFAAWLRGSRLGPSDGVMIFSVGGGDAERRVSANIVRALQLAREVGASIFGIVGRDGGYTATVADAYVIIPPLHDERITPHTEGLCAVLWHLLVATRRSAWKRPSGNQWPRLVPYDDCGSLPRTVCIVGGAGFIGSHFVDRLLRGRVTEEVRVYDNFSSGRRWHFEHHLGDDRFKIIEGDVLDLPSLISALTGMETVIHLASNPDIARAITEPAIDFDQGTVLTHHVLEAMRRSGTTRILYASGSGVYGDLGELEVDEDHGPLVPISTYGASKLAGEALIASYTFMFDLVGIAFRFGNVVGARQTHGVGFDFVRRLLDDPSGLSILGDGSQSKSYIHVADVVEAVLTAAVGIRPAVLGVQRRHG